VKESRENSILGLFLTVVDPGVAHWRVLHLCGLHTFLFSVYHRPGGQSFSELSCRVLPRPACRAVSSRRVADILARMSLRIGREDGTIIWSICSAERLSSRLLRGGLTPLRRPTPRASSPSLLRGAADARREPRAAALSRFVVPGIIVDLYLDMRILLGWAWTLPHRGGAHRHDEGISYFINQQARYPQLPERLRGDSSSSDSSASGATSSSRRSAQKLFPWRAPQQKTPARRLFRRAWSAARKKNRRPEQPSRREITMSAVSSSTAPDRERRLGRTRLWRADRRRARALRAPLSEAGLPRSRRPRSHVRVRAGPDRRRSSASRSRRTSASSCASSARRGAAMSTLIRILAGLDKPHSGSVLLDGHEVRGPGSDRGNGLPGLHALSLAYGARERDLRLEVGACRA